MRELATSHMWYSTPWPSSQMAEYANTVLACAGVLTIKQAAVVL